MLKENAKYKIMITLLDNTLHDTYTEEYNGVVYESLAEAEYPLKRARTIVSLNRRVCDVFLKEVNQ